MFLMDNNFLDLFKEESDFISLNENMVLESFEYNKCIIFSEEDISIIRQNIDIWIESTKELFKSTKDTKDRKLNKLNKNEELKIFKSLDRGSILLEYCVANLNNTATSVIMIPVTLISTIISYINILLRIIRQDPDTLNDPKIKRIIDRIDMLSKKVKNTKIKEKLIKTVEENK